MTRKLQIMLCAVFMGCFTSRSYAQLAIATNQSAAVLAQDLAGAGVTVLNATLTCAGQANGKFTASGSNLGISDGILLTTGQAASVAGTEPGLTSYNNNTNGDPALQVLSGASTTRDACILQFDLVPKGDTIKFDYVFGSEEYINSVCGPYNDAFAFFISGPGIAGAENIARVPGSNIPVAVNSINNGVAGPYGSLPNCTSMGPGSPFTTLYNDNTGGATVAYRGLTQVLTAAHSVNSCDTYHLKLTIADAVNGLYDSGVFIKAGSLQSTTFDVSIAGSVSIGGHEAIFKGCTPATVTFSRSVAKPTPQILTYQIEGTAVNGADYALISSSITIPANTTNTTLSIAGLPTLPAGTKTLKLLLNSPYNCSGQSEVIDSVSLDIYDTLSAVLLTSDTIICNGSSVQIRVMGNDELQYRWNPGTGLNNGQVKEPFASPSATTTYHMKAFYPGSGCDTMRGTVTIEVHPMPVFVEAGNDVMVCEHTPVSVTPDVQPDDPSFSYEWTGPSGFAFSGRELNMPDPLVTQSGYYTFTVSSPHCGALSDSVLIGIVEFPSLPVVTSPLVVCVNEKIKYIPVTGRDLKWYKNATGDATYEQAPDINTAAPGTFDFYVSQRYGTCESDRVKFSVVVERCCNENIFIPTAFTPNQDGVNDLFDIHVFDGSKLTTVQVFNRWGQLVYDRHNEGSWDGTLHGTPVELGNYYYNIEFTCKDGTLIHKKGEVLVVK